MSLSDSTHARLLAAGAHQAVFYPQGRGVLLEFLLRVKPGIANGTTTPIMIYSPNDDGTGYEMCEYSDRFGITTINPTIVSGTLTVGTPPVTTNHPPVINAISQTTYNVQLASTVTFSVSATDPDSPQKITLHANGLPAGATFGNSGQVVGNGAATGTFTWANISQVGNFTVIFTCEDDSGASADPTRSVTINVGTPPPTETSCIRRHRQRIAKLPAEFPESQVWRSRSISTTWAMPTVCNSIFFITTMSSSSIHWHLTERLTDFTIYDNIGGSPGNIRVVAFGLDNQRIAAGTTSGTAIFNFWATIRTSAPTGNSPIRLRMPGKRPIRIRQSPR